MTVCGVLHHRVMSFCPTVRLSVLAAGFVPHAGLLLSAAWGVRLLRLVTCVNVCFNTSSKPVSVFASRKHASAGAGGVCADGGGLARVT